MTGRHRHINSMVLQSIYDLVMQGSRMGLRYLFSSSDLDLNFHPLWESGIFQTDVVIWENGENYTSNMESSQYGFDHIIFIVNVTGV